MAPIFIIWSVMVSSISAMKIPEGYVFDVQPLCSKTAKGKTKVHVLTDLDVHVEGECKDNYIAQFTTTNYVDWYLDSLFEGDSLFECLFTKKNGSNTYTLFLSVSWAEPGGVMLNHDLYMIICVLDDHGKSTSQVRDVEQGLLGPREIQAHMGGDATSKFTLQLTDILGREFNSSVALGRKVHLTATMPVSNKPGAQDEVGLRAINCAARSGSSSYKILKGGCGDGIILPRDVGFKTSGRKTQSPIFTAFRLADSGHVTFSCNFTTCTTECDGDSCVLEKRIRRDLRYLYSEPTRVVTIPLQLDVFVHRQDLSVPPEDAFADVDQSKGDPQIPSVTSIKSKVRHIEGSKSRLDSVNIESKVRHVVGHDAKLLSENEVRPNSLTSIKSESHHLKTSNTDNNSELRGQSETEFHELRTSVKSVEDPQLVQLADTLVISKPIRIIGNVRDLLRPLDIRKRSKRSIDGTDIHLRSANGPGPELAIDRSKVHIRSAAGGPVLDAVEVDPCTIPGITMEGCSTGMAKPVKNDFPIGVMSLMIVVMVIFPLLLVIGLAAFFCCTKSESYGINEDKINAT